MSKTVSDSHGKSWLQIRLNGTYCVSQVISTGIDYRSRFTQSCAWSRCEDCNGNYCLKYSVTVNIEGEPPDFLVPDCVYGNMVTLGLIANHGSMSLREISVMAKGGNMNYIRITMRDPVFAVESQLSSYLPLFIILILRF